MSRFFPGRKTFALGLALIAYVIASKLSPDIPPLDTDTLGAWLGAIGITLRMGMSGRE